MDLAPTNGLLHQDEAFRIRGAAFEVYRAMGAGFLEAVYQECLEIEFAKRGVPYQARKPISLNYDRVCLRQTYVADFVCFGLIVLELKAVRQLAPEHRAQTINYLRAAGMRLGLLLNFGSTPKMEIERFAL
jgi:GxxExxY protein